MKFRNWLVWSLALLGVGGCATTQPDKLAGDPAGELRQARIEYRCDKGMSSGVTPVSHDEQAESTPRAVTTIEFPHPDGDLQSALVTLVEQGAAESSAKRSRLAAFGAWADRMLPGLVADERIATAKGLKISKQELDEALRELVREGGLESTGGSRVAVSVQIDGWSQTSHPKRAASLERLTERVRSEGMVLPADHPHVVNKVDLPAPRDDFYRSFGSESQSADDR